MCENLKFSKYVKSEAQIVNNENISTHSEKDNEEERRIFAAISTEEIPYPKKPKYDVQARNYTLK